MNDNNHRVVRIGCGAGFSGDRIDPAVELAKRGELDYLMFECLAERTIALAQKAKLEDPSLGYDPLLAERLRAVLPACIAQGTRIVSNMGAANPLAAALRTATIARELGFAGLRIAAVVGDDVTALWQTGKLPIPEEMPRDLARTAVLSANAYLGHQPIVAALRMGADIVLTGRVADPSLAVAPLVHEFGWAEDHWRNIGQATLVGHLLECAGQLTGGYFADPGRKDVPDLARLGFPIAEVSEDGSAVLTKTPGSGGQLSVATCTEQLLYELHDPGAYLTPDVTADLSAVRFEQLGRDRIRACGASGNPRPEQLKVSVGYHDGFIGEGQISYAGTGAVERGRLALRIIEERLGLIGIAAREVRCDLIGVDAICGASRTGADPAEVRVRVVARTDSQSDALRVGREVEALYTNGPAGGGGVTRTVNSVVAIASSYVSRTLVAPQVLMQVS